MTNTIVCPDCQTEFTLRGSVPLGEVATYYCSICEKPVRVRPAAMEAGGAAEARVLLAEDGTPLTRQIADLLRQAGYSVRTTTVGRETLEVVREFSPDLLLLDLPREGSEGIEVLEGLRDEPAERRPRVLVISPPSGAPDILSRVHALGAHGMIPKPALRETLLFRVQSVLH